MSDSTYVMERCINNFFPHVKTLNKGKFLLIEDKVILLNRKGKKYKVLKVKKEYLLNNILLGIIKERYY